MNGQSGVLLASLIAGKTPQREHGDFWRTSKADPQAGGADTPGDVEAGLAAGEQPLDILSAEGDADRSISRDRHLALAAVGVA
jgi:hypothetical protein